MRYHDILHDNMNNGDGLRVVLFESGCTHHCAGCQNPQTWDKNSGVPFDEQAKREVFEELSHPWTSGITFSGGDPLAPFNRDETFALIAEIRKNFPTKSIWIYTGYEKDELQTETVLSGKSLLDMLKENNVDVIVTGRFELDKRNVEYEWAGSTNQEVLRKESEYTVNTSEVIKFEEFVDPNKEPDCCDSDAAFYKEER